MVESSAHANNEDSEDSIDFDGEDGVVAQDEEAKEQELISGSKRFQSYRAPVEAKKSIIRVK
jgi:hypothetical protein